MTDKAHIAQLKKGMAAWNAWRDENPDIRPDLSEANLYRAQLSKVNLGEVNLREANLSEASLYDARLAGADLREAKLYQADLNFAKLGGADLSMANLSGARLRTANAKLFRANLNAAHLGNPKLVKANLTGADLQSWLRRTLRALTLRALAPTVYPRGARAIPGGVPLLLCEAAGLGLRSFAPMSCYGNYDVLLGLSTRTSRNSSGPLIRRFLHVA